MNIGDCVRYKNEDGQTKSGVILKVNIKTFTIRDNQTKRYFYVPKVVVKKSVDHHGKDYQALVEYHDYTFRRREQRKRKRKNQRRICED